ncbi:MAG: GntR family transcriptional regulator [Streptosporangiaceae bacterium]
MSIDLDSPVPRWRQLADILRRQIVSGELAGRLPGEKTLMQEYGLSQGTVRHALAALREEDLIVTTPGLASYVVDRPGK